MEWRQLIIGNYERISQVMEQALEGLTLNELNQQPSPDSNSMGWLAWHLTRLQDRAIAGLMGEEQLWVKDGWHSRFNRPHDPQDVGIGHSSEDLAAFKSPDVQTLLAYHHAVLERSKHYISRLSESDLDRKLDHPRFPTVGARLAGIISDNFQHAGQIAYVRGLLKGKGWRDA
ncbi:MAG: DinB family protein [Deltaproteobacteria bacterium]|nr:MAG: DinB family protein [Deltaproteobacteria bacterium]